MNKYMLTYSLDIHTTPLHLLMISVVRTNSFNFIIFFRKQHSNRHNSHVASQVNVFWFKNVFDICTGIQDKNTAV